MSNENPNPPSDKVIEAILKYGKMANRYADQGFAVRGKLAEMNGLPGIENVMLGNGSSEIYDMILRSFLQPGDEVIQHTPCFGIYKLRTLIAGGKIVSVPMIYKWGDEHFQYDPEAHPQGRSRPRPRSSSSPTRTTRRATSWIRPPSSRSPRPASPSSWTRPTSSTPA